MRPKDDLGTLAGKTVVSSGGGSQLGRLVTEGALRLGAEVHCIVPVDGAGPRLRASVPAELRSRLTCHTADLTRMGDVKQTADAIRGSIHRVDALIDVAETYLSDFEATPDGIEKTFAVNHLARFILANMLMPALRRRPGARIVSLSSVAHIYHDIDPHDWENRTEYDGWRAYCRSKQADILFVKALARRLDPGDVTANACDGGLQRDVLAGTDLPLRARMLRPFITRPAERVVDTVLWLAASPEAAGITGKYFVDRTPRRPADITAKEDLQEALWATSISYTGLGPTGHTVAPGGGLPVLR